jgi:sugar diacid utilization regulator
MSTYKEKPRKYWLEQREIYQPLVDSIADVLSNEATIVWESADGLGILRFGDELANTRKIDQIKQAEELLQTIVRHKPEFDGAIGVADRAENLSELGMRYRQAVVSAQSGPQIWPRRKIFHYHYISDQKQLDSYIERTLGPVLHHDKNKKMKLLPTLEGIMLSANLKSAANMLSIHYKTLMVRKRQLEQIFGTDLNDIDVRITLSSAIKLMKLRAGSDE